MTPPFVIFGLPRSRTFWLSRYLSYGGWECAHEEARHMRSPEDVAAWLAIPCQGAAETAAAPFWRTLHRLRPDARVVVVRRAPADVLASLGRLGIAFDADALGAVIRGLDGKLDQIEARWPGALSVRFEDLAEEATCARVFEHCLPFRHDPAWWRLLSAMNLQTNMPALMRYCEAFRSQMTKLAGQLKQATLSAMAARSVIEPDGMTFQQERFEPWYRDAAPLFRDHMLVTGQGIEDYTRKNLPALRHLDEIGHLQVTTARSNGRLFGYLMAVLSPSLDSPDITSAMHLAFFADPALPGLGMKLQRVSIAALRARGAGEVFFRAGTRGTGPRLGSLYRRMGAEDAGQLYRLEMGN